MSLVNSFETSLLELLFQNVALPNVGDAAGLQPSASAGIMWVGLHESSPTESATDQNPGETFYNPYFRRPAARSAAGWTVTGNVVDNAVGLNYNARNNGGEGSTTITHFGIGEIQEGNGRIYVYGPCGPITFENGVKPQFAIGALDVSLD